MPPIRILNLFSIMDRGGAETMVMNYYRALDRDKIQFDFLVHRKQPGAYDAEIRALGGRIFYMPPIGIKTLFRQEKRYSAFFNEHPEYRIIHGHMSELGYAAYKAAKRQNIPVRICHAHNYPLNFDLKTIPRNILKWLCKPHITHMFTCSQPSGEWLFGKNNRDRLVLMRNAIDTQQFIFDPTKREKIRKELGLDHNFVIGHVGRFDEQKNHKFLIEIFAAVLKREPQAVLLLVGDGHLRPAIEAKAALMGIADKIRFLGVRSDIPDLLQAMDVFVFPSLFEGLPVTSIEAQASGLSCVFSNKFSMECDVTGNVRFLPLAAGAEAWVEEILKLQGVGRLPDAAQKVAAAGYDVRQTAKWLEEFYLKIHA